MQYGIQKKHNVTIEFILLMLYAAMVFMFDGDEVNVRLIYVAYGLLCLSLVLNLKGFTVYREVNVFIFYLVFGVLSMLWAVNLNTAFTKVRTVFLLLVLLVLLTSYTVKIEKPIYLIIALIVGSVALSAYMFYLYGVFDILDALFEGSDRIGGKINNVNAIANTLVIGIIALIGVAVFYKKRLTLLLLIPTGICLLVAGSRTATISFLVGVLLLFVLKLKTENNGLKKFLRFIVIILIIVVAWLVLRNIPVLQEVMLRIENAFAVFTGGETVMRESSAQMRKDFIEFGWAEFLKSPIWGNGIGCAGYAIPESYSHFTYLHNNYIEMLASGGVIGFVLFYTPYVLVLISLIKRIFINKENNSVVFISFALLIARLVGHFGTVVYYSKVEFLFLAMLIAVVNLESKNSGRELLSQKKI